MTFSRKQVLAPRVLALDEVVAGTEKLLRRLIGEDVELMTVSDPDLGRVRADPGQIEQVLVNLAVNARDAMPDGGKLAIELTNVELGHTSTPAHPAPRPGSYVMLAVIDNGCGMDAETVSHIFEPFFTTKEEGKGTGLGLATVYAIVQQSGGAIEVDSQPGQGTTFRIYLPTVAAGEGDLAPQERHHAPSRGSETVLLVEDDERVRALISNVLTKNGYTVLEAARGDQALELAHRHQGAIHLLVTDVVMPGMNGRVLSERLSALRPETRVLYMSGYSDDAILSHGVQDAGKQFIQKPFSVEAFAYKIREALEMPAGPPAKETTRQA